MSRPAPALAALITALGTALAPPAHARTGGIADLADAAAERITVSRDVAATKWAAGTPIDDPEREAQVLRDTTAQATAAGVPADTARAVVGDQIEASKILQRGLHARWAAHPDLRPRHAPGTPPTWPRSAPAWTPPPGASSPPWPPPPTSAPPRPAPAPPPGRPAPPPTGTTSTRCTPPRCAAHWPPPAAERAPGMRVAPAPQPPGTTTARPWIRPAFIRSYTSGPRSSG